LQKASIPKAMWFCAWPIPTRLSSNTLFGRLNGRHFLEIFSIFLLNNIHNIIYCHYTDQSSFIINHRHGKKIIFFKQCCNFFLLVMCVYIYYICIMMSLLPRTRHLISAFWLILHLQVFWSHPKYSKYQSSLCLSCLLDMLQSLFYRHFLFQVDILYGHYAPGRVFRIVQKLVYKLSRCFIRVLKNPFYNVWRHFLQKVNCIVQEQFIQMFFISLSVMDSTIYLCNSYDIYEKTPAATSFGNILNITAAYACPSLPKFGQYQPHSFQQFVSHFGISTLFNELQNHFFHCAASLTEPHTTPPVAMAPNILWYFFVTTTR